MDIADIGDGYQNLNGDERTEYIPFCAGILKEIVFFVFFLDPFLTFRVYPASAEQP